jgi:hypothetical protein
MPSSTPELTVEPSAEDYLGKNAGTERILLVQVTDRSKEIAKQLSEGAEDSKLSVNIDFDELHDFLLEVILTLLVQTKSSKSNEV